MMRVKSNENSDKKIAMEARNKSAARKKQREQ